MYVDWTGISWWKGVNICSFMSALLGTSYNSHLMVIFTDPENFYFSWNPFADDMMCRGMCLRVNGRKVDSGLYSTKYPNTKTRKSTLEQELLKKKKNTVVSAIKSEWKI